MDPKCAFHGGDCSMYGGNFSRESPNQGGVPRCMVPGLKKKFLNVRMYGVGTPCAQDPHSNGSPPEPGVLTHLGPPNTS